MFKDPFMFERENREKIVKLVQQEIQELKNVKVSFQMQVKFSIERDGEIQERKHFFQNDETQVFNWNNEKKIKENFDKFIEITKGEVEQWNATGSGWEVEKIELFYVKIARYDPLGVGSYLPLPENLAKKNAIINVKNRDNECLKWALRAALFPPKDGKNALRPSKYPVNDGINYEGIDFLTPVKQTDKLEAQNRNLAINVFGWKDDHVVLIQPC